MKNIPQQPQCPECEKLAAVSEESNKIGSFLDWMISNHKELPYGDAQINQLLADYYDIDLNEVEKERRALLEWLREVQSGGE